jgi:dolichyl-phosphate beta-glucosyltransferase
VIALSIIVPAYNEAERLPATLRAMRSFLDETGRSAEVIVVDDGSRDTTSAVVRELATVDKRLTLIRLPQNRGKGYAVRTGVVNAAGERVLFADADGATPIEEITRLEKHLDAGAQVAIGSRGLKDESVTVRAKINRKLAGRIFHQLVRRLTVSGFVDTQCGFKMFTAPVAQDLFSRMRMDGFSFDVEVLLMAERRGYRVVEVPVNWNHQPGSKINVVADGLRMAADLFRIRSYALRGLYDDAHISIALPGQSSTVSR